MNYSVATWIYVRREEFLTTGTKLYRFDYDPPVFSYVFRGSEKRKYSRNKSRKRQQIKMDG